MSEEPKVTAALVKELRDRTGVGMAKCKAALDQVHGNIEDAIDLLRKQGMASAVKKEGRETKEGVILFHVGPESVALCEVNAETDFVAKNERFLEFAQDMVKEVALSQVSTLEELMQKPYSKDPSITLDQYRALVIQTIGENIQVRRFLVLKKEKGTSIGIYSHMNGKIVTAVTVNAPNMEPAAKDVAMHVAAASPEYLNPEAISQEIIAREREIAKGQVEGKPAHIMDKILDGKMNAFFDMCCLVRQKYIKDDSMSVEDFIKKSGKAMNIEDAKIISFIRWSVGQ